MIEIAIEKAYVARGDAMRAVQEHFEEGGFDGYTDSQICMDRIKNIPAADVVERKKGKWIRPVPGDGEPHCSECKAEAPLSCGRFLHHEYTNFCPNCGADLREGKDG